MSHPPTTPSPAEPAPAASFTPRDPRSLGPGARFALIAAAVALLRFAAGFVFREPWATDTWPFPYAGGISHIFIASIMAAGAASLLSCALLRDPRAMVGVGIDAVVINAPIAFLILTADEVPSRLFGIGAAATALAGLAAAGWFRRYAWRDTRPTPIPVRLAFAVFVLALWVFGGAMAAGGAWSTRILPWEVPPEVARIYGWTFLGASTYFLYSLLVPVWSNAAAQLLAFLAYDLVLIPPFIAHFQHVTPDRLPNHIAYCAAVATSAILAIVYCFILPRTRIIAPRPPASPASPAPHP